MSLLTTKPKKGYKLVKVLFDKYEEVSEEWEIKRLGNICKTKPECGVNISSTKKDEKLPRYIRITDLNDDVSLKENELKSIKEEDTSNYILNKNDFLFARTYATVGKTYLHRDESNRYVFASYLIRFNPDQDKLKSEFLFQFTHSNDYCRWLISIQTWGMQQAWNEFWTNILMVDFDK